MRMTLFYTKSAIQHDRRASLHAFADELAIHGKHLPALTRAPKVMIAKA